MPRPPRTTSTSDTDLPQVSVERRDQLRAWLLEHHETSTGAWLVTTKCSAGGVVAWNDIVEEVLCFGWIDSLPRVLDDTRTMLRITPRKPASAWSAKNKAHVASLIERGLMHSAGLAVVDAAKASGTWTLLDEASALVVPADLEQAMSSVPAARGHWDAFPPSARRAILEWLSLAKRPDTRAARVAEIARLAGENRRANAWKPGTKNAPSTSR